VLKTVTEPALQGEWHSLIQRWAQLPPHPNLRRVLDWFEVEGQGYAALEYLEHNLGQTLPQVLTWPLSHRGRLLEGVAHALDVLHQQGLVYGALRPENILWSNATGPLQVKLAEPGLETPLRHSGTLSQYLSGRPDRVRPYLSPEEADGHRPTPEADCFAFAALAYHLLTEHLPFGEGPQVYDHLQRREAPPPPSSYGLPQAMDDLFRQALAWEPPQRFPSCG
jgi:serine/threonine protein kinase